MSGGFEEKVLSKLDAMDQRFDAMDQRFDAMDQRLDAMDQRFDAMDQTLQSFREEVNQEFWAVRIEMQVSMDKVGQKIEKLDNRVGKIESVIRKDWDVPNLKIMLNETMEKVGTHSQQIREINAKLDKVCVQ